MTIRFTVLGAGAIGAYVGAALARGGADVTLIARGAHLRVIQKSGVRVYSPDGDFQAKVTATDSLDALSDADVIFLGLKAYSLPALATELSRRIEPGTTVIAAQNGVPWWYFQFKSGRLANVSLDSVDPGGAVAGAIDPASVLGCVIYVSTEIAEPGVIKHIEGRSFAIGEPGEAISERCRHISEQFVAGGLKAPVVRRIREHIWLKLVGNVAFNPISVLTGATMGELGALPETKALARTIMEEAAAVAAALDVKLHISLERRLEAAVGVGAHRTSMLQDYEAGKPLEFECLTGALVELADLVNVDVPATRTVHACVKLNEARRKLGTSKPGEAQRE